MDYTPTPPRTSCLRLSREEGNDIRRAGPTYGHLVVAGNPVKPVCLLPRRDETRNHVGVEII